MGFNFATVSYLSLASEVSGEQGRGKTIATMWFMMILGIIFTAILVSQMVDPYTPQALIRAFWTVGIVALILGVVGLLGLEARFLTSGQIDKERHSWGVMLSAILENRQATVFFIYLVILLAALLGQDVLLEPFGAEAFGMSVRTTTRITSLWGSAMLAALAVAAALERRFEKRRVAAWGGLGALSGLLLITLSGLAGGTGVFYTGVILLGVGTGLSTVSNLSLMLDMTTAGKVGLFIGAWGMANAVSRLVGNLLSGMVRDLLTQLFNQPVNAYVVVFCIEAGMLLASLLLLRRIDVSAFKQQVEEHSLVERAALASEA
jgi:BCD family chlorophyll transporter-like MFS transporter